MQENTLTVTIQEQVALVEFTPGHQSNAFSNQRMLALTKLLQDLSSDDQVRAIVLYGGKDRSFSVGGDFNEVSNFTGGDEVSAWLDNVNNLYSTVLRCPKPTIAVIDHYAIGFGLQLALTCDFRIASSRCELKMPELAIGIACNFGGYMLEKFVNRTIMQEMLFNCNGLNAEASKAKGLVHEVVHYDLILSEALKTAKKFGSYPSVCVAETKNTINKQILTDLQEVCCNAKNAHKKSFSVGIAQTHMRKIIKKT